MDGWMDGWMDKRKSSEWEGVEIELELPGGSEGVD